MNSTTPNRLPDHVLRVSINTTRVVPASITLAWAESILRVVERELGRDSRGTLPTIHYLGPGSTALEIAFAGMVALGGIGSIGLSAIQIRAALNAPKSDLSEATLQVVIEGGGDTVVIDHGGLDEPITVTIQRPNASNSRPSLSDRMESWLLSRTDIPWTAKSTIYSNFDKDGLSRQVIAFDLTLNGAIDFVMRHHVDGALIKVGKPDQAYTYDAIRVLANHPLRPPRDRQAEIELRQR